jgi:hypothetical protein
MSGRGPGRIFVDPRLLLAIPIATYGLSYLYLAGSHGRLDLWSVVVHESGRLTLLESTFYASHFLGHTPVLITIALLFGGCWLSMSPLLRTRSALTTRSLAGALAVLIATAAVISVWHFGVEDTVSFVLQRKQRPDLYTEGGSWNLHLPSTMLQFLLIPVVVWGARWMWCRPVEWSSRGLGLVVATVVAAVGFTWLANGQPFAALVGVWSDPRYLAHSVRELATFPLTYYPLPLATLLMAEETRPRDRRTHGRLDLVPALALVLFLAGFCYQVVVSLAHDVGSLAQRPDFAHGGELSILYLLAAHYFEHFLDSIFFALLTLLAVESQRSKVQSPKSKV